MRIETFDIVGPLLVRPVRHGDARGWFEETYHAARYAQAGIVADFCQDNQSFSAQPGIVRGLHFQIAPFAQAKLVRVLSGAILDVAVDLRRSSPTFGRHVSVRLDATDGAQMFIPHGFAHGFCTLAADTAIAYKVDAHYSREHDRGIRWNDPALGIAWPVDESQVQLSDKDRIAPLLAEIGPTFE